MWIKLYLCTKLYILFRAHTCTKNYNNVFVFFSGYTAVMVAADQGDSEALKLLLEAGANINCRVSKKTDFLLWRPLPTQTQGHEHYNNYCCNTDKI